MPDQANQGDQPKKSSGQARKKGTQDPTRAPRNPLDEEQPSSSRAGNVLGPREHRKDDGNPPTYQPTGSGPRDQSGSAQPASQSTDEPGDQPAPGAVKGPRPMRKSTNDPMPEQSSAPGARSMPGAPTQEICGPLPENPLKSKRGKKFTTAQMINKLNRQGDGFDDTSSSEAESSEQKPKTKGKGPAK